MSLRTRNSMKESFGTRLHTIGKKNIRHIANNTWVYDHEGDTTYRLHETDVVTYHSDGRITVNSGGWLSKTTADRIRGYIPDEYRIHQRKDGWRVSRSFHGVSVTVPFEDGMDITQIKLPQQDIGEALVESIEKGDVE